MTALPLAHLSWLQGRVLAARRNPRPSLYRPAREGETPDVVFDDGTRAVLDSPERAVRNDATRLRP